LRDRIRALEQYAGRQKVVSQDFEDRDLFALAIDRTEDVACGVLFKVREGKVVGRQHTYLRRLEGQTDEALMQVLLEAYYAEAAFFPDEVLLSGPVADPGPLEALLRERRGKKVSLRVPERGDKAGLIRMVAANARLLLDEWRLQKARREEGRIPHAVKALQRDLNLPRLPRRIECFDVSHLGGTGIVASCVVFEDGRPRKKEYRTYKVRSVAEGRSDDYQALREVVARRYRRVLEENGPWPDLVVIDGGKGQLACAVEALQAEGVYGRFPVVGLAKRLEEVFFPGDRDSVVIPRTSSSLQLLQRVRNEAHRFAVTFQRKQRQKRTLHSELTAIPGVGEQRVRTLLRTFGSVRRVKAAPEAALAEVVGPALAARIRAHFDARDTDGA
ncbi:MAG: excinuclease ABC subunit C, partial [Bacteroidetes bacterium]